jgi:hypothetical protein
VMLVYDLGLGLCSDGRFLCNECSFGTAPPLGVIRFSFSFLLKLRNIGKLN